MACFIMDRSHFRSSLAINFAQDLSVLVYLLKSFICFMDLVLETRDRSHVFSNFYVCVL